MTKSSSPTLRIALAQLNPTVGDLDGNAQLLRKARVSVRIASDRKTRLP
jgi:predicted amidohydrolase